MPPQDLGDLFQHDLNYLVTSIELQGEYLAEPELIAELEVLEADFSDL
ncbi:MAG TPA: hypothetical protein VK638_41335 [Edaphobacter sp.]|nr:hypothetical protein [Edaphobacter sp.]